jgi:hypothetical protein
MFPAAVVMIGGELGAGERDDDLRYIERTARPGCALGGQPQGSEGVEQVWFDEVEVLA